MNAPTSLWSNVQHPPSLATEQVHVCGWNLDRSPDASDWTLLDEEETVRAQRFVFPRDRDRYVCAHATVRRVLGGYLKIPPADIRFSVAAYGKPALLQASNQEVLQFNLSHSAGIAVLAVSHRYQLGIDVECIRNIDSDVAEHHFSPHELLTLQSLPSEDWLAGFYRCWTSKEALLKGEGLGLNLPLDSFDVEVHPLRAPALLASRSLANLASDWILVALQPTHEAIGTLAIRSAGNLAPDAVQCFFLNE